MSDVMSGVPSIVMGLFIALVWVTAAVYWAWTSREKPWHAILAGLAQEARLHQPTGAGKRLALAEAAIEQVDLFGNLRKQGIERLVENFEPGDFGIAQVDDHAGAVGGLDPGLPQRVAQPDRMRIAGGAAPGILRV